MFKVLTVELTKYGQCSTHGFSKVETAKEYALDRLPFSERIEIYERKDNEYKLVETVTDD